jgi:hypothetical protein
MNDKNERIKYSWKSAIIDFLIVNYEISEDKLYICSFDVTIA